MSAFFTYWFWPNPGAWSYSTPIVVVALVATGIGIVASMILSSWRRRLQNQRTKVLSRSWTSLVLWFSLTALVLVLSRVEGIQFFAMRVLWVVWFLSVILVLFFQILQFRRRHYTVMKHPRVVDERDRYLPRS